MSEVIFLHHFTCHRRPSRVIAIATARRSTTIPHLLRLRQSPSPLNPRTSAPWCWPTPYPTLPLAQGLLAVLMMPSYLDSLIVSIYLNTPNRNIFWNMSTSWVLVCIFWNIYIVLATCRNICALFSNHHVLVVSCILQYIHKHQYARWELCFI